MEKNVEVSRFPKYLEVFMKYETGFCGLLVVSQMYRVIWSN